MREKALKHVNYLPSTKTQMDTVSSKGWWLVETKNRAKRRVNVGLWTYQSQIFAPCLLKV